MRGVVCVEVSISMNAEGRRAMVAPLALLSAYKLGDLSLDKEWDPDSTMARIGRLVAPITASTVVGWVHAHVHVYFHVRILAYDHAP